MEPQIAELAQEQRATIRFQKSRDGAYYWDVNLVERENQKDGDLVNRVAIVAAELDRIALKLEENASADRLQRSVNNARGRGAE